MSDKRPGPPSDRASRLAQALRENLKRRKTQSRGRRDAGPNEGPEAADPSAANGRGSAAARDRGAGESGS